MSRAFDRLTDAERECLRLVHKGLTSKAIAKERGTRADTVDDLIDSARLKLGGVTRRIAANLLFEHEAGIAKASPPANEPNTAPHLSGAHSSGMEAHPPSDPPSLPQTLDRETDADQAGSQDLRRVSEWLMAFLLSIGLVGSRRNDLARWPSATAIALFGAAGACIVGGTFSLLMALDHMAVGR